VLIAAFVQERATALDATHERVADEFIDTVIGHYGTVLERAGEVHAGDEHLALIAEARDALDLFREVYFNSVGNVPVARFQTSKVWERLLNICLNWRHFTANAGEPKLRQAEATLLAKCVRASGEPLSFYEVLGPWKLPAPVFDKRSARLKKELVQSLLDILEPKAVETAIKLFAVDGGIRQLFSADEHLALTFLLSAPESPVFAGENKAKLKAALDGAGESPTVHRNCADFLDLLLAALEHHGRFCTADARKEFFIAHADISRSLWAAVVARPFQFRFLDGRNLAAGAPSLRCS
jgi:hypothetical protein